MVPQNSEKLENLLILALNATDEELDKSKELLTGYNRELNTWELIVKSNASLAGLESPVIQVEELINGYSIVNIREDFIEALAGLDEIEYIEKPKALYFAIE